MLGGALRKSTSQFGLKKYLFVLASACKNQNPESEAKTNKAYKPSATWAFVTRKDCGRGELFNTEQEWMHISPKSVKFIQNNACHELT